MFDFISTFQQFLDGVFFNIKLMFPYDPLLGTQYDWVTSIAVQYGIYVLYILLLVILVVVVLGLFKTFYYIFRYVN